MTEQLNIPANEVSFKDFLIKNKPNRTVLWLAAIAIVIQFTVFKYFYPFASYIHGDSFVYLETAFQNFDINTYMVGYSRFLRFFSSFTSSDTALIAFQYLLIQISSLLLLFTSFYFYKPSNIMQILLLCFIILNPLFLYIANLVSSDGFFLALSLIWFSLLIWIIHKPTTLVIVLHAIILFIAFTVRYNALIYPIIAVGALGISNLSIIKKIIGVAASSLLCVLFIAYTGNKYKILTGKWQYSPFSGWQMTNNAMYSYRYVDSTKRKSVPKKFYELDKMIRTYFDTTRDLRRHPQEAILASTAYMWDPRLPLYKYRDKLFEKDTTASEFKKWSSMGPLYKEYGIYIIKQYPWHYIKYFLWPNANKYYAPPVEFLSTYNSGKDSVTSIAQVWFKYKSQKMTTRVKSLNINTLNFYPILTGIMNMVFLCCILCFAILNGFKTNSLFRKCILMVTTIWLTNAMFTIFASSAALRFQSFPILIVTIFALLLIDWVCKTAKKSLNQNLTKTGKVEIKTSNMYADIIVKP